MSEMPYNTLVRMVENYYRSVEEHAQRGKEVGMSLREYLDGIRAESPTMTEQDVEQALEIAIFIGKGNVQ